MSEYIVATRLVGVPAVVERFSKEAKVRARIRETMEQIGEKLRAAASQAAPKGPTGRLKRSIRMKVYETDKRILVRIIVRKFYGRFVEKGTGPKEVRVRTYVRATKAGSKYGLKRNSKKNIVRYKRAQGITYVRAHNRTNRTMAQPFLVPTVDAMSEEIMERIKAVAQSASRE